MSTISSKPMFALRSMWSLIHGPNGSPSPKPGVDRVLEVRVRVDEARHDRRALEPLARSELRGRAHGGDPRPFDHHRAVPDRLALDGEHPVGGVDGHSVAQRTPDFAQRRSMIAASWIESSKRMTSGSVSSASETGSTVGRSTAITSMRK